MKVHTKILSVDDITGTAVVRFYTDMITESDLASQVDSDTGEILRCTTDFNCWLPREPLQDDALIAYMQQFAPVEMFDRMEKARAGAGIDTTGAKALLKQVLSAQPPTVVTTTPTLAQAKADKKAAIKLVRQSKEAAGVLVGTTSIDTDSDSRARINTTLSDMQNGFVDTTEWKGSNGWVTLDLDSIKSVAQAVAVHTQSCFAWEKDLCSQVDAAKTIAQLNAININATVTS